MMLLKTLRSRKIDATKLITHRFKFDQILDASRHSARQLIPTR
jgi:threonine dehydrogenase-like Zn-dependent dehydrogenase